MQKQKEDKHSSVVGIISCKAGVGKSFIALNLAKQISLIKGEKSLFVDLSLPFGGSAGFIETVNESWHTIRPLLTQSISPKKLGTVITSTSEGFDYLGSPASLDENTPLTGDQLKNLINSVKSFAPVSVFDLPTIRNKEDLARLSYFDKVLCIITPEPEVLTSTASIYKSWTENKLGQSWTFILNRWDRKKLPKLLEQVEKKLRINIAGSLEEDPDALWHHYFSGKLLEDKDLVLTQDFKNLAELTVK